MGLAHMQELKYRTVGLCLLYISMLNSLRYVCVLKLFEAINLQAYVGHNFIHGYFFHASLFKDIIIFLCLSTFLNHCGLQNSDMAVWEQCVVGWGKKYWYFLNTRAENINTTVH